MNNSPVKTSRWWWWAALLLTAFKLWLTRGQAVYAIAPAAHDEKLFLQLANHLVRANGSARTRK